MPDPPRMDGEQIRRMKKLVRGLCANCDGGCCILLDETCPQLITSSLICKYFRAAVLPEDAELHTALLLRRSGKRCALCGTLFVPASNRAKYCPNCSAQEQRRKTRERVRRYRASM